MHIIQFISFIKHFTLTKCLIINFIFQKLNFKISNFVEEINLVKILFKITNLPRIFHRILISVFPKDKVKSPKYSLYFELPIYKYLTFSSFFFSDFIWFNVDKICYKVEMFEIH